MKIKLHEILIEEIVKDYINSNEDGVVGYGGKLNIRPKYQREFVYKDKQRDAVMDTVRQGFPLNVMYWAKNADDYEVLDGQQRTISICEYVMSNYSISVDKQPRYFHNLEEDKKQQILNYKLMVYFCEGADTEKLDWFKTINIAGEKLYDQELRNAIYTGTWLTDAKKYFSQSECPAHGIAHGYMKGSSIRQDYLETVIRWISNDNIEEYMAVNQHKPNANELWMYFNSVITWTQTVFPHYRKKEMKGVEFGELYNKFKDDEHDSVALEEKISILLQDEDVTNKPGVYHYVLTEEKKYLNIRAFTDKQKSECFEKQKGVCIKCKEAFSIEDMEADHIKPWSEGGKTIPENCQMLCKPCNRSKSNK